MILYIKEFYKIKDNYLFNYFLCINNGVSINKYV
jgi:hypothetical protein